MCLVTYGSYTKKFCLATKFLKLSVSITSSMSKEVKLQEMKIKTEYCFYFLCEYLCCSCVECKTLEIFQTKFEQRPTLRAWMLLLECIQFFMYIAFLVLPIAWHAHIKLYQVFVEWGLWSSDNVGFMSTYFTFLLLLKGKKALLFWTSTRYIFIYMDFNL